MEMGETASLICSFFVCGITYNCPRRSVHKTHLACSWHTEQPRQKKERTDSQAEKFHLRVARGFYPGTPVSSPASSVSGSANEIKLK